MIRQLFAASAVMVILTGALTAADKEVKAKFGSLDPTGKRMTVAVDGKNQVFALDADVSVMVNGKESKDGLKDKALKAGAELTLTIPDKGRAVTKITVGGATTASVDKPKTDKPKFEVRGLKATITKIDADKGIIFVSTEDGKKVELNVDDDTKFYGPRGGLSDKGIKDDRVAVGHEIHFLMSKNNKKVEEVHLPVRKSDKK